MKKDTSRTQVACVALDRDTFEWVESMRKAESVRADADISRSAYIAQIVLQAREDHDV